MEAERAELAPKVPTERVVRCRGRGLLVVCWQGDRTRRCRGRGVEERSENDKSNGD